MNIIRVFIVIFLFFLSGCDNTAPELQSAQINTHDNNLQSDKFKDGDCYNKNPNRWWNKNLLHSLLLLDPGFTKFSNQPKYTFNNSRNLYV